MTVDERQHRAERGTSADAVDPDFRRWLLRAVDVSERDLDKIIGELLVHWGEDLPRFARRRHRELRRDGLPVDAVFVRIASEVPARRFKVGSISARQIRRLVYG